MKIYISGAITGVENEAKKRFDEAEKKLKNMVFDVVNPMKLPHNHDKTWGSFMREDLKSLLDCDAIYLIEADSDKSRGVELELMVAKRLGIDRLVICESVKSIKMEEKIITQEQAEVYQDLYVYFLENYNLGLTIQDMDEIINKVELLIKKQKP